MSVCLIVDSVNNVSVSTAEAPCDFYALTASENAIFQLLVGSALPSPEDIFYVYTWGMGAVLLPFSVALALKWAVRVVKLT